MFTLHSIKLVGGSNPVLRCVRGHNLGINASEESMITAGSIYARFVSILSQDSSLTFDSYALDQVFSLCGLWGLPIGTSLTPSPTYTSAELYFAKYDTFGQLLGTGNHIKMVIGRGLLHWTGVNCQTNQDATISSTLSILDPDSGALPVVITTNANLPTAGVDDVRFSLGPAALQYNPVGCMQSLSINSNQSVQFRRCGSDVYPKSLQTVPIKPTLSLSAQQTDLFSATKIPYTGLTLAHADTAFFLRKRLNNQVGFRANDQSEHIKITAAGLARVNSHTSQAPDPGVTSVSVTTIDDATNAPIVITTGTTVVLPTA